MKAKARLTDAEARADSEGQVRVRLDVTLVVVAEPLGVETFRVREVPRVVVDGVQGDPEDGAGGHGEAAVGGGGREAVLLDAGPVGQHRRGVQPQDFCKHKRLKDLYLNSSVFKFNLPLLIFKTPEDVPKKK